MVLSCENELPDILRQVDIVNFREAMTERREDYDIAFVEGSISRKEEAVKLRRIRKKAKVVVALGACSSTGGLNCLKNRFPMSYVQKQVYGKNALKYKAFETQTAKPVDAYIHVDYYIHGCPIPKKEFLTVLTALLLGNVPKMVNHPVCVDCKMAGNICVFEKGKTCLGPVTRAGCDAICVTYGCVCWGCRGLVDDPNTGAHEQTLKRYGLSAQSVTQSFDLYGEYGMAKR